MYVETMTEKLVKDFNELNNPFEQNNGNLPLNKRK